MRKGILSSLLFTSLHPEGREEKLWEKRAGSGVLRRIKRKKKRRIEERCDEMSAIYKLTSILLLKDTNKINAFQ